MGSSVFSAQYQQATVPAKCNIIKRKWLKKYKQYPEKMPGDQIVQSWDTASKDGVHNDWSVCVTALIRKRTIYVRDVYRAQLNFPDLRRMAEKLAVKFQTKALLIEDAASGQQLIQQLRRDQPNGVPRPIARKPEGDKATRLVAASVRIENGDLLLPEDAPWLDLLERELLGFPNARHDDQVDALAQLLNWANTRAVPDALIPGCGGAIINMVPYSSNEDFGLR